MGIIKMKTQVSCGTSSCGSAVRRKSGKAPAFTLIELLVVITIMALLMAVATPFVASTLQANRLTAAGDSLLFKLSSAIQIAGTENRPVELRFYFFNDGRVSGCHASQLFYYDQSTNKSTPMEAAAYLGENSVVMLDGTASPIFSTAQSSGSQGTADIEPFKSKSAIYKRIIFYPNGSTNLDVPLRTSYLTLVGMSDAERNKSTIAANYYIIQIDPVTGRASSFRP
jgi:uncharacterized protein (TIGR02596 family)